MSVGVAPGAPPPLPADLFAAEPAAPAPAPEPVAAAAAAAPAPAPAPPLAALHTATPALPPGAPLSLTLAFTKPAGAASPETSVLATLALADSTATPSLTGVSLQAAVPKYARLALAPASGQDLAPGAPPITQTLSITNTAHGAKPLALRLRLGWRAGGGEEVVEMVQVDGLPEGL